MRTAFEFLMFCVCFAGFVLSGGNASWLGNE